MMKRWFALASVSALGGLVSAAGCSEDPVVRPPSPDAGARTSNEQPSPTGPPASAKNTDDEESKTCVSTEPVDATKIPYVTVGATPGACTEDESKALMAYLNARLAEGADFTDADWASTVTDKCAKCVFTQKDAPKWGVIIDEKEAFFAYNFGGCVEMLTGSETCGRAVQQAMICAEKACTKCATEQEFNECLADPELVQGPCKDAVAKISDDCEDTVGQHLQTCNDNGIQTLIRYQCVTGVPGGAKDAGG